MDFRFRFEAALYGIRIPFVNKFHSEDDHTAMNSSIESPPAPAARAIRADARRNREAIVVAAKERFSELGLDCQMEDVARSAKVGIGTVYRHFPNKDALIEALIEDRFERLAARAREALEEDDAWEAFRDLMRWSAELSVEDRSLSAVLTERPQACGVSAAKTGLSEATAELMRRAQRAGQMRKDAVVEDVPTFMCGLGGVIGAPPDSIPGQNWERLFALVMDGLRATDAPKLPKPKARFPS